jgi:hypothetical protein
MANTYVKIASVSVGVLGAATMDFTSIPATYTDLQVLISARSSKGTTADSLWIRFNGSSTSYSDRTLYGSGSAASSFSNAASGTAIYSGELNGSTSTASTFSNCSFYIPNYAGSTNKSTSTDAVDENNATAADAALTAGLWSNTAAITQITILPSTGPLFVQYSTAALYGIKKN